MDGGWAVRAVGDYSHNVWVIAPEATMTRVVEMSLWALVDRVPVTNPTT